MTQRVDVHADDGLVLLNQLVTNARMRARVWEKAAAGKRVTITPSKPKPPPPPPVVAPYGTKADAGVFAGRGIMLGSNPDVWNQAYELARNEYLEVVAVIPSMPALDRERFTHIGCRAVVWSPPELHVDADITQAESQTEWDHMGHGSAICANSWTYGRFDHRVALVETYYNEGWGVDFGIFKNYTAQGAKAVIPVGGGYHAGGRSDAESARIYASLATLPFPGFWMYAGESMLTAESVEVLKGWRG